MNPHSFSFVRLIRQLSPNTLNINPTRAALLAAFAGALTTVAHGQSVGARLSNLTLSGSTASPIKAPAVGPDGMLYISGHDGIVRCVDPNTYQVKWRRFLDTHVGSPVCGPDGRVFVGGVDPNPNDGSMTVLDATTGNVIHRFEHNQRTLGSSGLITPAGHLAYVAGRRFFLVETTTFKVLWTYDLQSICGNLAVNARGVVYIPYTTGSGFGKRVVALDTVGRREVTSFQGYTFSRLEAPMSVAADGTLYLPCDDGELYALDGTTGDLKWSHDAGASPSGAVIGADGRIYYGSQANKLFCLDPRTGGEIWVQKTKWNVDSTPCIGESGRIYVTSGRYLYAFDSTNGAQVWFSDRISGASHDTGSAVLTAQGKIHYGTYDGALVTVYAGDRPSRTAQWGVEGRDLSHSWRVPKPGAGKEIGMGQVAPGVPAVLLRGFAGDTFTVEYSSDLKTWTTWGNVTSQSGLAALDPLAAGLPLGNCAFRVR